MNKSIALILWESFIPVSRATIRCCAVAFLCVILASCKTYRPVFTKTTPAGKIKSEIPNHITPGKQYRFYYDD